MNWKGKKILAFMIHMCFLSVFQRQEDMNLREVSNELDPRINIWVPPKNEVIDEGNEVKYRKGSYKILHLGSHPKVVSLSA